MHFRDELTDGCIAGYLEKVMPFREYNYEEYYGEKMKKEEEEK